MNQDTQWRAEALRIEPMLYDTIRSIHKAKPSPTLGNLFLAFCIFGCICEFIAYLCGFPNR